MAATITDDYLLGETRITDDNGTTITLKEIDQVLHIGDWAISDPDVLERLGARIAAYGERRRGHLAPQDQLNDAAARFPLCTRVHLTKHPHRRGSVTLGPYGTPYLLDRYGRALVKVMWDEGGSAHHCPNALTTIDE